MAKKSLSIEGIAMRAGGGLKFDPIRFTDTTFQNYAEKIASDYAEIIKALVLPELESIGDLKFREIRVLASIYFFDVPITPAQISEILRFDPATVSRAVRKLEAAKLLIRQDDEKDKRSIRLKLTQAGLELSEQYTQQIDAVFGELESRLLYGLTAEEKTDFLNVMIKISRRAEAMKIMAGL